MAAEKKRHKLTAEERRKGGVSSGVQRRKRKHFQERLDRLFSAADQDEAIMTLITKAKSGDLTALKMVLDYLGELPPTDAEGNEGGLIFISALAEDDDEDLSGMPSE